MNFRNGLKLLNGKCFHKSLLHWSRNYRAAFLKKIGDPLELQEKKDDEKTKLKPNEVRLNVESAGMNNADLLMIRGTHYLKPSLPFVPGFEVAGEVMETGESVSRFRVGDRVAGVKRHGCGGFAERCVIEEQELYGIPHSMSYETAASFLVAYGTAYLALQQVAKIKEGDWVLVLTSQGSSGLAAIDLAQNVFCCRVVGATESEEKCAVLRELSVMRTVEYTDEDLRGAVLRATGGSGVDVLIDTGGGFWFHQALKTIKPGGHVCSLGFSSHQIPSISLQDLLRHRLTVSGISFGGLAEQNPEQYWSILRDIMALLKDDYIKPQVTAKFPLEDVNSAFQLLDQSVLGKIVLTMNS